MNDRAADSAETTVLLPGAAFHQAAVFGVRFALYRAGSGGACPVLLLHGVPQTAVMWRALLPVLARDRVVLAPDLKGLGRSEGRGPYDAPTLAAEMAALVLQEVGGPVDVVGSACGGSIAMALAAERPDLVRRLVVCNAPFRYADVRRVWHVLLFSLPAPPEGTWAVTGRRRVDHMIRLGWRAPHPPDERYLEHYRAAYDDRARLGAMLGYYRAAMRSPGRRDRSAAGRPAPPAARQPARQPQPRPQRALVIWGARDPVLPLAVGRAVVRDLGGGTRLLAVPYAGHYVVEEAPEVVVPAVAAFLAEPDPVR
ncbi:hypothetical protein C3Y87_05685 [Carbonactinospora thermoautotrophica]|uniref:alpha/beta fold hydrolase n=1 Tax=Carbonactinospora thermoautotrophica TaxID=1469144 RepID=UPI002271CF6A|nr:alpha/beta hydrolase [Carbonactinospora thermoautotrophica]MCX9190911.1 hypothetical protein [Carbonactinospora thermoautotrophica]